MIQKKYKKNKPVPNLSRAGIGFARETSDSRNDYGKGNLFATVS